MYFLRAIGAMVMTIDQAHDFYTADNIKTIIVAALGAKLMLVNTAVIEAIGLLVFRHCCPLRRDHQQCCS